MEETYKVSCGRTVNRGNWVSVSRNGYSVHLSDDHERGMPQIELKNKAVELLEVWLKN